MGPSEDSGTAERPEASATVTVVIPCFNQARYLPAAIASVRQQTRLPQQLIVVDDGSTDTTADVARALRVELIAQPNRGLPEARNAGLAAARGEYIVLLDADDELLPDAIERGLAALDANPSAAAAVGRCQPVDEHGRHLPANHHPIDPHNLYRDWLSHNFVWTPGAAIFRTAALRRLGGFPSGLGGSADYAVYLRFARADAIACHRGDVVRYRQHATSMSRDPVLMLRHTLTVLRRERAEAPPHLKGEVTRGMRTWRRWYGEHMVERLRRDWRDRGIGRSQLRGLVLLIWHCPGLAVEQLLRKTRGLARRAVPWLRPAPAAPEQRRTRR